MSAQPTTTATDTVNIEIDGRAMQVAKGSMVIQAADQAAIPIPRFCYHRKLAIAANCRMCLVEVEMGGKPSPKPLPACATPVAEGMKVFTRSAKALHAQRNVMEFLLINHPLDCPICDQGGECELQDLALGYGRSVSRFTERKRVVADENLGPLVQTFMTRCIQCTRCIRVLDEIAGSPELGGMDRGEDLKIGTWIGKSIASELSGNIIDVCPVGALTDKVYQFKARAWEMIARPSIGYHDAAGANLWLHTLRGRILRAVPRDNEAINECWLSDRDRYSHEGLYADDRVIAPMVKRDGQWQVVDWDRALGAACDALSEAAAELGVLVQPATSCEEGALLARLGAGLECAHIDHRLRRLDFAGAISAGFEVPQTDVADAGAVLLVGCDIRHELPLLNARLRKSVQAGGLVYAVNPLRFDFNFGLAGEWIETPHAMVARLLTLAKAAQSLGGDAKADDALATALAGVETDDDARAAVNALRDAEHSAVVLGEIAGMHPQASWLEAAVRFIAAATGSRCNTVPLGANTVGLARVGVLPGEGGLDARAMLEKPRPVYVLYGAEPPEDFADGALLMQALQGAGTVIACTAYASDALKGIADVILPIGLLPESDATLVSMDGQVQTLPAATPPPGDARPGWRVLRALGGFLDLPGFDFVDIGELRTQISDAVNASVPSNATRPLPPQPAAAAQPLTRVATVPIYRGDAVLRRATALNAHPLARAPAVMLHRDDAKRLGFGPDQRLRINDNEELGLRIDDAVATGSVWIECAHAQTALLPPFGAAITLDKA